MGASKNTFMGLAVVAMCATALLAGCQKEEVKPEGIPTTINILSSKTSYNMSDGSVTWSEGDQLGVIRGTGEFSAFNLTNGAGTGSATFEGMVTGTAGDYIAVYPYSDDITYADGSLHFTAVKPQQTLKARSFGEGDNVSVGVSATTSMEMRNVGGLLKLAIKNDSTWINYTPKLKSITITANGSTKIAGSATMSVTANEMGSIIFDNNAVNSITAVAPTDTGFRITGGEFFYIAMPPCTLHGYTIILEGVNGMTDTHTYTDDLTITRAGITRRDINADDFTCKIQWVHTSANKYPANTIKRIATGNNVNMISYYKTHTGTEGKYYVAKFDGPITTIPGSTFSYSSYKNYLISVTLPNTVTTIAMGAFNNCTALKNITIPNSVTTIESSAFSWCSALETFNLPNNLTAISPYTFSCCTALTNITIPNSVTRIDDCAFYQCSALSDIAIPANVDSIGKNAFAKCTTLTNITIPLNATHLGEGIFSGCSNLASAAIYAPISTLGNGMFQQCSALNSVTLPSSIHKIGKLAFEMCTSLQSITLPESVNTIDLSAFLGCSNLDTVNCYPTTPPTCIEDPFSGTPYTTTGTLYIPSGSSSYSLYQAANIWKDFATISPTL